MRMDSQKMSSTSVYLLRALFTFFSFAFFSEMTHAAAVQRKFTHIPQSQIKALKESFKIASREFSKLSSNQMDLTGHWSCLLFGASSGFQKALSKKHYVFTSKDNLALNEGAMPLKKYIKTKRYGSRAWVSSNPRLTDEIVIASNYQLYARTRLSSQSGGEPRILSYSVCTIQKTTSI